VNRPAAPSPFDPTQDLKDAPHTGARMRPKDAATLILVRRDGPEPALLMGRRASGHVFMASKWVFPGGRIDRADFRAPAASELRPQVAALLEKTAPAARARALGLTAIREAFEETGVLLARAAGPQAAPGPWRAFVASGALPDLSALSFIARAVTPPGRARRFDARFFMAEADRLLSLEPATGDRELDEIAWIPRSQAEDLDLPAITRFVIKEIAARLADGDRPVPYVYFRHGKHRIDSL